MITFAIGLAILIIGTFFYGKLCEKIIKPSDNKTPAVEKFDGIDYVPMKIWRNSLIELLNIAGPGPIIGPIQGILFGPIAFLTIPVGCVIGGAFHDYMCGMISVRNGGDQMPSLVRRYLGKYIYLIYYISVCVLMLLVGVVLIYTPGDLFVTHILGSKSSIENPIVWVVYGAIFVYCIVATLLPIDKIIGKIYPFFGAVLLFSSVGIFVGMILNGYPIDEIWEKGFSFTNSYGDNFIPIFFVTVSCGIVSGFHSTQATLIARTIGNEQDGIVTFYDMMILEGFIAMVWAAAAMGASNIGIATNDMLRNHPTAVVGIIAKNILGSVGGTISIIGVIVLPITSGDTALRSLRIMISDALHIDTRKKRNNLLLALIIFSVVAAILVWAKADESGFNLLWRYSFWANEIIAVYAFAMISVYMIRHEMPYGMALIPGMFYMFVVTSYILNAKIGLNIPWTPAYILSAVFTFGYAAAIVFRGKRVADRVGLSGQ